MSAAPQRTSWLRRAGWLLIGLAFGVLAYWAATSRAVVTQYEVAAEVVEEDEFGDEITRTVMMPAFRFGLLPDRGLDAALPLAGLPFVLGIVALGVERRRRLKSA